MDKKDEPHFGIGSISPITLKEDVNGEYELCIRYDFPIGKGESIKDSSVLVKPFERLILKGNPLGKIAFVFYGEKMDYKIIGAFANTIGERILFFPGLTISRVIHSPDNKELTNITHNIDHFSLDNNLTNWHVTLKEKETKGYRYPKMKTGKINNDVFLWFVMAIPHIEILEPMPKTQDYLIKSPKMDEIKRRMENFMESRRDSLFPVIPWDHYVPSPYFLNFEIFVLRNGKKESDLPEKLFFLPPPYSKLDTMNGGIRSRACLPFPLGNSITVSIRVSKIKGSLVHDAGFYSGKDIVNCFNDIIE